MLISFSHHGGRSDEGGNDRFRTLTRYMDAPMVMKQVGTQREPVLRSPAPEILVGRADTLCKTLSALPFAHRYTSFVLSFAPDDIDPAAFNAGDPVLRGQVDLTLRLAVELAWAGIPPGARPAFYATTHTHVGRLEVNLAIPRAVYRPDGRGVSHNTHPPGPAQRSLRHWEALQDLVNHRFSWADPRDPRRRRIFRAPDRLMKRRAEMRRAGLDPALDPCIGLVDHLDAATRAGEIRTNADMMDYLARLSDEWGFRITSHRRGAVTLAIPGGERLHLHGPVLEAGFEWTAPTAAELAAWEAERLTASTRLAAAWERRAAYNLQRCGQGVWPAPDFGLERWLTEDPASTRRMIPSRHHLLSLSLPYTGGSYAGNASPHADGAGHSRYPGANRTGERGRYGADGGEGPNSRGGQLHVEGAGGGAQADHERLRRLAL